MNKAAQTRQSMLRLLLGEGQSEGYWDEVGTVAALEKIEKFSEEQWKTMASDWSSLSIELQDRLAYLLGEVGTSRAAELLLQICFNAEREIELTARESLREMPFDVVKIAAGFGVRKGDLPFGTLIPVTSVNQLLDFLREVRRLHDMP